MNSFKFHLLHDKTYELTCFSMYTHEAGNENIYGDMSTINPQQDEIYQAVSQIRCNPSTKVVGHVHGTRQVKQIRCCWLG